MDWKEQLKIKEKEFNLAGGINESKSISKGGSHIGRSDNRSNIYKTASNTNNIISSRSSDLLCGRILQKTGELINVAEKGGNTMITVDGALKDLEKIEKETEDVGAKAVVQAMKVLVKFLSTMRSNQLLTDEEKVNIKKAKEARVAKEVKK